MLGEASDGLEALELVQTLRPDVLVVDLMMPGMSGLDVITRVAERALATKIVVLSMHHDNAYVAQALRNGALAYVLKDSGAADLVQAVQSAMAGERYLSPPLSLAQLEQYERKAGHNGLDMYEALTAREREVLLLTAQGRTSALIAHELYISARTVETHRTNLMRKLGLHSQAELIHYAIKRDLLLLST